MAGVFNRAVFNPNVFNTGALTSGDVSLGLKKPREEVIIPAYNSPIYVKAEIPISMVIRKKVFSEIEITQPIIKPISFEILSRMPIRKHITSSIIPIKKISGAIELTIPINPLEKTELYKIIKILTESEDGFDAISDANKVIGNRIIGNYKLILSPT